MSAGGQGLEISAERQAEVQQRQAVQLRQAEVQLATSEKCNVQLGHEQQRMLAQLSEVERLTEERRQQVCQSAAVLQ